MTSRVRTLIHQVDGKPAPAGPDAIAVDGGLLRSFHSQSVVLMIRDSGCRAGELVSMRVSDVKFEEVDGRLRGRVIIYDAKTMASRFAYFGHDAVRAIDTGAKTTADTVS